MESTGMSGKVVALEIVENTELFMETKPQRTSECKNEARKCDASTFLLLTCLGEDKTEIRFLPGQTFPGGWVDWKFVVMSLLRGGDAKLGGVLREEV